MRSDLAIGLLGLAVLCVFTPAAEAQIRPSGDTLKKSVGLVFYDDSHTTGGVAAFCIGKDGTYLTNSAAVWAVPIGGTVEIYLKPGQKDQRIVETQLKMRDANAGLTLLRASDPAGHVPLSFHEGRDRSAYIVHYESVKTALDLEDTAPNLRMDPYALPRSDDAGLPAAAGAPVVSNGGLLTGAIGGRSRNGQRFYASLARHEALKRLRELPVIMIKPVSLEPEALAGGSIEFEVEVGRTGSGEEFSMKGTALGVEIGRAPQQVLPAPDENGRHRLSVPIDQLFRRGALKVWVEAQVEEKTGERLRGLILDSQLRFDQGKVVEISKLERIEFGKVMQARDRSGGRYGGAVGLPSLETPGGRTYISTTGVAAIDFGRSFTEFPADPIKFAVEIKDVSGGEDAFAKRDELHGEIHLDDPTMFNRKAYLDKLETLAVPGNGKPVSPKVDPQVVQLPAKVEDMSVAGAGRFLVLYFGAVRKIGVFDLETRELGAFVALEEDRVMMAAGGNRVIGVGMESGKTHSWSLPNLKQVSAGRWPQGSVPKQLSMGSSASRAIGIAEYRDQLGRGREGIIAVDASNVGVQEIRIRLKADRSQMQQALMERLRATRVISSQSGNSFAVLSSGGRTISHCVIFGGSAQASLLSFSDSVPSAVPSNTGSLVFTSGHGIWDSSLQRGYDFDILHVKAPCYLPSEHQNYFFSLSRASGNRHHRPSYFPVGKKKAALVFDGFIHDARTRRPVGILPDLSANLIKSGTYSGTANLMDQVHKRFILSPKHKTLVTFSQDLKRLELFPIGITPADKWEHGVLQVKSNLHLEAKKGRRFEFKLQVDASDPPLRYLPPQGTPDFEVNDAGKFSWDIPDDYNYSSLTRHLEIVDSKGRHFPFRVRIKTEK